MSKTVLFFFLYVSSFYSFGQIGSSDGRQITNGSNIGFFRGDHLPDSFLKSEGKILQYKDINGTPYINNNQKLKHRSPIGKLYTSKNKFVSTLFIRYNVYTDNIELSVIDDGIDYYLLKKKPNSWYILLGKNKYRAYEFFSKGKNINGFFVIVSENDTVQYSLLKREKAVFKDEIKEKNGFLSATPPAFRKIKDTHFVKIEDKVIKIPKKKKDFLNLFTLKQQELKKFILSKKYKITNEKHLLKIINYYNSIVN